MNGHKMVSLVGNLFSESSETVVLSCNFCASVVSMDERYDYCFHCSCFLCKQCEKDYSKINQRDFWLSVDREEVTTVISDFNQLKANCSKNKSQIVAFILEDSSPSQLLKDTLIYHLCKLKVQPRAFFPHVSLVSVSPQTQSMCD